jgi:hypothetical protein
MEVRPKITYQDDDGTAMVGWWPKGREKDRVDWVAGDYPPPIIYYLNRGWTKERYHQMIMSMRNMTPEEQAKHNYKVATGQIPPPSIGLQGPGLMPNLFRRRCSLCGK